MAAQAIDYTALAKQAGAISSTPPPGQIDYAALAKQAGAISSTPPPAAQPAGLLPGTTAPAPSAHPAANMQPSPLGGFVNGDPAGNFNPLHPIDNYRVNTQIQTPDGTPATALHNFGAYTAKAGVGAVKGIGQAIAHPFDAIGGMAKMGADVMFGNPVEEAQDPDNPVVQKMDEYKADYDKAPSLAAEHAAGDLAGNLIVGEGAGAAWRSLPIVGSAAQDAGVGLMNKTVGTLKSDFKRGANPARGYFEAGNGPSMSMQSIADKAATSKATTGSQIGDAVKAATDAGTKLPTDSVVGALNKPIQKGIALETGPGGMGNTIPIENYSAGFRPAIADAVSNGGFSPDDVFAIKRGVASNTNWSDPSQFNMKAVRQQQAGALSGVLSDAIPELPTLNMRYQDLTKLAARAQSRAETGSLPLTTLAGKGMMSTIGAGTGALEGGAMHAVAGGLMGLAADSVPVKSTIASGLYYGGKAATSAGNWMVPPAGLPTVGVAAGNLATYKNRKNKK